MMLRDIFAIIAIILLLFPILFNKTWHKIIDWIDEMIGEDQW